MKRYIHFFMIAGAASMSVSCAPDCSYYASPEDVELTETVCARLDPSMTGYEQSLIDGAALWGAELIFTDECPVTVTLKDELIKDTRMAEYLVHKGGSYTIRLRASALLDYVTPSGQCCDCSRYESQHLATVFAHELGHVFLGAGHDSDSALMSSELLEACSFAAPLDAERKRAKFSRAQP